MEKIDEKDKRIIELISRNPRITQKQLAEKLNISQPAVSMRISKLREIGLLEIQVGINPEKAKMVLAKVEIKTKDVGFLTEISKCPYVIFASTSTGKFNVILFMAGEDYRTLEAVVNRHIREIAEIDDLEFNIILDTYGKVVVPIKTVERYEELPKCALKLLENHGCRECFYYKKGTCLGCPLLLDYKGKLFKMSNNVLVNR